MRDDLDRDGNHEALDPPVVVLGVGNVAKEQDAKYAADSQPNLRRRRYVQEEGGHDEHGKETAELEVLDGVEERLGLGLVERTCGDRRRDDGAGHQ